MLCMVITEQTAFPISEFWVILKIFFLFIGYPDNSHYFAVYFPSINTLSSLSLGKLRSPGMNLFNHQPHLNFLWQSQSAVSFFLCFFPLDHLICFDELMTPKWTSLILPSPYTPSSLVLCMWTASGSAHSPSVLWLVPLLKSVWGNTSLISICCVALS